MANSTSNIDLVAQAQASKEITVNGLADAASPAMTYGRRQSTCSGLTFGYYGGNVTLSGGTMSQIANGTLTLTASATNYIVANKATGVVSASTATTNWNDSANYWRLYSVVVGAATVTSYTDSRELAKFTGGGGDMILASDQTVTGAKTFKSETLLLRNIADTFSSLFSNSATAARTWTLQDRNGILADDTDLALKAPISSPSFTGTLAHSGDVLLSGNGKRIIGEFSSATTTDRIAFQTSTVNGNTVVGAIPNGTGIASGFRVNNAVDTDNAGFGQLSVSTAAVSITSGKTGTGAYIPLNLVANNVETLRLDISGNSLHLNPAGGLGYGTGAGGTVTQTTSKSADVTLNKPCGRITMNAASLAANTKVRFTLNNSLIAADDEPRFWIVFPGSTSYRVWVDGVATGACGVIVENYSAGPLSDAVVIGFELGKGSVS